MKRITIAKGDGIGPEIMDATLKVLKATKADLAFDEVEIGEKVYLSGNTSGISNDAWDAIRQNKIFLKAPITTPQGGGYKSLNVTTRKTLNLFANVRPCRSFAPFIDTKHPEMDVVIIRENEEDLYAGIEHRQTDEVEQCLKLITRPGCEKIIKYAFEYAVANNRKRVTCFSKDNIMKQTDGLFRRVFNEIRADYPQIESDHHIIDIASAKLANRPQDFDVIVTANLYGDIISDIAAEISGSVGLCGSSNIGEKCQMFEAIHGSAPDIAGKGIANPTGLLMAAVHMLNHIGFNQEAKTIEAAILKTIEDGLHTADIYSEAHSKKKLTTSEFADAVISNFGHLPQQLLITSTGEENKPISFHRYKVKEHKKELVGVDVFLHHKDRDPNVLGEALSKVKVGDLNLIMITNRGVKVWPNAHEETFSTDHWRCRFYADGNTVEKHLIIELLQKCLDANFDVIKTENLYTFDGKRGFSLGQGQ